MLLSFIIVILTVSLFCIVFFLCADYEVCLNFRSNISETDSCMFLRADVKLKSFRATLTDHLWQFMQNTL